VADWVAISSLATAGGTLALAATTYASVRSANRAAHAAESSMLASLRPLLLASSPDDTSQRVGFFDDVGLDVPGGGAGAEVRNGNVYVAISLRNVGTGIAVLHGARFDTERLGQDSPPPLDEFRMLSRDLYIPPAKLGFWQGAWRNPDDPERAAARLAVENGSFRLDVLYGDYEGGQRVITRFGVLRDDRGLWLLSTARHWQVDRDRPR
jgi:hypothetical protein